MQLQNFLITHFTEDPELHISEDIIKKATRTKLPLVQRSKIEKMKGLSLSNTKIRKSKRNVKNDEKTQKDKVHKCTKKSTPPPLSPTEDDNTSDSAVSEPDNQITSNAVSSSNNLTDKLTKPLKLNGETKTKGRKVTKNIKGVSTSTAKNRKAVNSPSTADEQINKDDETNGERKQAPTSSPYIKHNIEEPLINSIKILESTIIELKEQVNRQDNLIEQLNSKCSSNNPKSLESKINKIQKHNSVLFETINTQHVCLDDITERLPKQEKTLQKYKETCASKSNDNIRATDMAKNDILLINERIEVLSNQIKDLQHHVQSLHPPTMKPCSNNIADINVSSVGDSIYQQQDRDAYNRLQPLMLILLATIWKQNNELSNRQPDKGHPVQDTKCTNTDDLNSAENMDTETRNEKIEEIKMQPSLGMDTENKISEDSFAGFRLASDINQYSRLTKPTESKNVTRSPVDTEECYNFKPKRSNKFDDCNDNNIKLQHRGQTSPNKVSEDDWKTVKGNKRHHVDYSHTKMTTEKTDRILNNNKTRETKYIWPVHKNQFAVLSSASHILETPKKQVHFIENEITEVNKSDDDKPTKDKLNVKPPLINAQVKRPLLNTPNVNPLHNQKKLHSVQKPTQTKHTKKYTKSYASAVNQNNIMSKNNGSDDRTYTKQSTKQPLLKSPTSTTIRPQEKSNPTKGNMITGRRKCLIVHDAFLNKFDTNKFSSWFDVHTSRFKNLKALRSDGSLLRRIKDLKPEILYLHIGAGDLFDGRDYERLVDSFKDLIWQILHNTESKICISLLIPIIGYPTLNEQISRVNSALTGFISDLRTEEKYKSRVFTTNNNSLSKYICRGVDDKGVAVTLTEHGQMKLWLHLKDSFNRALGKINPRFTKMEKFPRNKIKNE